MRILRIPFMVIGLVDETQSLVRVVFSQLMPVRAASGFHGLFSATQDAA